MRGGLCPSWTVTAGGDRLREEWCVTTSDPFDVVRGAAMTARLLANHRLERAMLDLDVKGDPRVDELRI